MPFRVVPSLFKEPGEQNMYANMLQMGLLSRQLFKKFDKTGAVHNLIRKNKEPSQKRKNATTKLKVLISEDPSLSIRQISKMIWI